MIRMVILLILPFLYPLPPSAGGNPKIGNLRPIPSLRNLAETLTPDARQSGITEERVQSRVRAHFREWPPRVAILEKDGPSLYVRFVLYKKKSQDLYDGMIGLGADRPAMIGSSQGDFPGFSQIWEKPEVFSESDPFIGTFEILAERLSLLIEDFKEANLPARE